MFRPYRPSARGCPTVSEVPRLPLRGLPASLQPGPRSLEGTLPARAARDRARETWRLPKALQAVAAAFLALAMDPSGAPTLEFRSAPSGQVMHDSLLSFEVAALPAGRALPESCGIF